MKVNGDTFCETDLIKYLKLAQRWDTIMDFVHQCLIDQFCAREKISATEQEVSDAMDAFRAGRGLFTEAATLKWLNQHQLSDQDFFAIIERQVKQTKLKELISRDKVEQKFAHEKVGLDEVELYRIVVEDESVARELMAQIREGADFYGLAKLHTEDADTRSQCGYLGVIRRSKIPTEIEGLVLAASEGEVVGPVKSLGTYQIFLVDKIHRATLDDRMRERLKDDIFREWLEAQVRNSQIEVLQDEISLSEEKR